MADRRRRRPGFQTTPSRGRGRSRGEPNRGVGSTRPSELAPLLDLCGLAAQVAQVVELGAAYVTARHDLDGLEDRRVEREGPLDADAEGDLADGEGAADAGSVDPDDDALEDLDAGAVALDDLDVHLDGVTGAEGRDVVALDGIAEIGDHVAHGCLLASATGQPRCRMGGACSGVSSGVMAGGAGDPLRQEPDADPRGVPPGG